MQSADFKEGNKMDAIRISVALFPDDVPNFHEFTEQLGASIEYLEDSADFVIPLAHLHKFDSLTSTTEFEDFGSIEVQNAIDSEFQKGLHSAGLPWHVQVQRPYVVDEDFRQLHGTVQIMAGKTCTLVADFDKMLGVQHTFAKYASALASELRIDLVPAQDNNIKLQCKSKEFEELDITELLELHEFLRKDEDAIAHDFISKQQIAFKVQRLLEPVVGKNNVRISASDYLENDIAISVESTGRTYSWLLQEFSVDKLREVHTEYTRNVKAPPIMQVNAEWQKNCIAHLYNYSAFLGNPNNYEDTDLDVLRGKNLGHVFSENKMAFKVQDLQAILDCAYEDSTIMFETVRQDLKFHFRMVMNEVDLHSKIMPLDFEKIEGKWHLVYSFEFEGTQNNRKFRVELPNFTSGNNYIEWMQNYSPFVCAREIEYIYKKGATGLPSLDVLLRLLELPKDMRLEYGIYGGAIDEALGNTVQLPNGCRLRTTEDMLLIELPTGIQVDIAKDLQRRYKLGTFDATGKLRAIASSAKYTDTNLLNAQIRPNGYFELKEGGFIARAFDAPVVTMTCTEGQEMKASKEQDVPNAFKGKTVANMRAELHANLHKVGGGWTNDELTKRPGILHSDTAKEITPGIDCIPAYANAQNKIGTNFNSNITSVEEEDAFNAQTRKLMARPGTRINAADINRNKANSFDEYRSIKQEEEVIKQVREAKEHIALSLQKADEMQKALEKVPSNELLTLATAIESSCKEFADYNPSEKQIFIPGKSTAFLASDILAENRRRTQKSLQGIAENKKANSFAEYLSIRQEEDAKVIARLNEIVDKAIMQDASANQQATDLDIVLHKIANAKSAEELNALTSNIQLTDPDTLTILTAKKSKLNELEAQYLIAKLQRQIKGIEEMEKVAKRGEQLSANLKKQIEKPDSMRKEIEEIMFKIESAKSQTDLDKIDWQYLNIDSQDAKNLAILWNGKKEELIAKLANRDATADHITIREIIEKVESATTEQELQSYLAGLSKKAKTLHTVDAKKVQDIINEKFDSLTRMKQLEIEARKMEMQSIEDAQPFSSRIADALCPNANAQYVPSSADTSKKEQSMSISESIGSAATTAANVVKDNAVDIAKSLGEQAMIAGLRHFIRTTVLVPFLKSSPMARLLTTGKMGGTRLGKWYAKRKVDAFMDKWISGNPLALIVLEYVSIWGAPRLLRSVGLLPEKGNAVISYLDEALTREAKRVGNSFMANFAEGFIDRAINGMNFGKPQAELGATETKVSDIKIDR